MAKKLGPDRPAPRSCVASVRLSEIELKKLMTLAKKYCDGDLSKWMRNSGLKYRPLKADLV